jgi:outer membrane receptor protein involved in Fe transport
MLKQKKIWVGFSRPKALWLFLWACLVLPHVCGFAQTLSGQVLEKSTLEPIVGATVHILGSKKGSVTDSEGKFSLELTKNAKKIVVRFVGFGSDTLEIGQHSHMVVELRETELEGVKIEARRETLYNQPLSTQKIQVMSEAELQKAACCNLAESFETNPSVDIATTDAIMGIRQVQMLGLASVYTQITQENVPYGRGLASGLGLSLVPGTWVEAMQVSKGTSSVANGYESMAGAINFDLRKPFQSDRFFFNLYQNNLSRQEANLHLRQNLNKKLSTVLLLHADKTDLKIDMNHDGFLDMPLSNQFNVLNRWQYNSTKGWIMQAGIKVLTDKRESGQIHGQYKISMLTQRQEAWLKMGRRFSPYRSFGSIFNFQNQMLDNLFGTIKYSGNQQSLYANLIYESIISTSTHIYKTGLSYLQDNFSEQFDSLRFARTERVAGVFWEYKYSPRGNFDLVLGLRGDYHSLFGFMATPRLHVRYAPRLNSTFRLSAGKGYRTSNFLMENMASFVSQRQIFMPKLNPYPFAQEQAWNFGINLIEEWELGSREGSFSAEYYHTLFENQVVADLDRSPTELHFYNLQGLSYSNSYQFDLNQELAPKLSLRLSYRYLDVKTTLSEALREKPLVAKHRFFANLAYSWKSWKIDATANWIGPKRLPSNLGGSDFQPYSPGFYLFNGQISKTWWKEKLDTYLGIENALGFRQKDLIVSPQSPFSPGFDGSLSWGPPMGRVIYLGLRMRLKS